MRLMMARCCLLIGALLASPAWAEGETGVVGFSRNGKQVLLRQQGELVLLDSQGNRLEKVPRTDRGHRLGQRLRQRGDDRLVGKGLTLLLEGGRVQLLRGKRRVTLWKLDDEGGCRAQGLIEGMRSPSRQLIALLVRRSSCEPAVIPVVISLPQVVGGLVRQATSLAHRGKLKEADQVLASAALLAPGSPQVTYRRACVAALSGDEHQAIALLRQLKAMRQAAARRLLVRSRFDRDFRLIKDSAAFKALGD